MKEKVKKGFFRVEVLGGWEGRGIGWGCSGFFELGLEGLDFFFIEFSEVVDF